MKLDELAKKIGAEVLTPGREVTVEADQVYAGDRISDLLNAAGESVLLLSNLASGHLTRVAELMDVPGICLVGRQRPDTAMIETAKEHRTLLMVSPAGLFETCGRVYRCLTGGTCSSP
ncbi:MAG TPA: hypothetical protein VMV94_12485 [Phycisphaerae bacterium]|nr:hypothetical protein [Phycisphaerae bacterium]